MLLFFLFIFTNTWLFQVVLFFWERKKDRNTQYIDCSASRAYVRFFFVAGSCNRLAHSVTRSQLFAIERDRLFSSS